MASKERNEYSVDVTIDHLDDRHSVQNQPPMFNSPERVQFTLEATERGPPPSYEEAIDPSRAPPPSYDSVIGRVREVHKESSGTLDFFKRVLVLLAGTIGCTIAIGVTIVVPVAMFLIGLRYLNECPLNVFIPVYLLLGGFVGVLKQILQLLYRIKTARNRIEEDEEEKSSFQSMITCFMMSWFFLGSYWVYKEYRPNFNPEDGLYCNRTVYLFAFWQVTSIYMMLCFITVCLCSVSLCILMINRKHIRMHHTENGHHITLDRCSPISAESP